MVEKTTGVSPRPVEGIVIQQEMKVDIIERLRGQLTGAAICGGPVNKLELEAADYIERLTADFERECANTDRLLQTGIGWTPDRTRTEGGSLKVSELAEAMRSMVAPGSGG